MDNNGGEEERRKATWKGGKAYEISKEGERRIGFCTKGFFFKAMPHVPF